MFLHVIPPVRAFTKVSNALLNRTELDPCARLLLAYVGGLPPTEERKPLSAYAEKLGLSHGTYKRIKKELVQYGYVHEYRAQNAQGLWYTDQWVSNVPLTKDEFTELRLAQGAYPRVSKPTVGEPGGSRADGFTGRYKTNSKTYPTHPPQEPAAAARQKPAVQAEAAVAAPAVPEVPAASAVPEVPAVQEAPEAPVAPAPAVAADALAAEANTPQADPDRETHFALAERILRDLRTVRDDLRLGFRNVRYLAGTIAEKLRQGIPAWEIHTALTHDLPSDRIHNAAGFVTHRLRKNLPEPGDLAAADAAWDAPPVGTPVAPPRPKPIVECRGPGRPGEHYFRPVAEETFCGPCRREHPQLAALSEREHGGWWAPLPALGFVGEPPF